MASDWEGLVIAPDDDMFTVSPTWERIDNLTGCRVNQIDIETGRRDEFERTDTGTMVVQFNDREGIVDPTNAATLDSKPIALGLRDPVTDEWFPRWRGVIDSVECELDKSQGILRTTITAVDVFDYLAGFELAPGLAGDPPTTAEAGNIVYAEEPTTGLRIDQALADASWPSGLSSTFTFNVRMRRSVYAPGESILSVLRDCADAEFPTVANLFVDKYGFFCAFGRYARFDPDDVSATASHWDFHRWKAGDGAAIALDPDRAQMRPPFTFNRSRKLLRNAALCYPMGIEPSDMSGQVVTDAVSIAAHGLRSWSATDLLVEEGVTNGTTANEECLLYAQYIVDNYASLVDRIDQFTVLSVHPTDARATATWALLTQIDISDIVDVEISNPGGGGFSSEHFVEGLAISITPLQKDLDTGFPMISLQANLSPVALWAENPFGPFS